MRRIDPHTAPPPAGDTPPELEFTVEDAGVLPFAAAPTLRFGLAIRSRGGEAVDALLLNVQIRIAVAHRFHDAATRSRLVELFGPPDRWSATPADLLWTQTTVVVPAFHGRTRVDLPVACTYDFEVASAKYLHAVRDGDLPLQFLFSGSMFYAGAGGLFRTARVPWDREAAFALPVRAWHAAMDHYFPASAWLRLDQATFDRLHAWKAQRALPTWEAAVDALLHAAGPDDAGPEG